MSDPAKNPFTHGDLQFVKGAPPKQLIDFNEMLEFFPEIKLSSLVPGHNYLVFTQSPRSPEDGAYIIVKYLRTDSRGNITVSELFRRNRSTYGWSNTIQSTRGSRFFKEEDTYPAACVYKDASSFTTFAIEHQRRSPRYFFRDIGERQSEFNDSELSDERVADIIEEIVDSQMTDDDGEGDDEGVAKASSGGKNKKRRTVNRKKGKRTTKKNKSRKRKTLKRLRRNKKMVGGTLSADAIAICEKLRRALSKATSVLADWRRLRQSNTCGLCDNYKCESDCHSCNMDLRCRKKFCTECLTNMATQTYTDERYNPPREVPKFESVEDVTCPYCTSKYSSDIYRLIQKNIDSPVDYIKKLDSVSEEINDIVYQLTPLQNFCRDEENDIIVFRREYFLELIKKLDAYTDQFHHYMVRLYPSSDVRYDMSDARYTTF